MAKIDFKKLDTYRKTFDGILQVKKHVGSEDDLPVSGAQNGDIYSVGDSNTLYIFNGFEWRTLGSAGVTSATVTVDESTGTPSASASVENGVLSISFSGLKGKQGIQGPQGNTGSSVDYPYELVNNLTDGDATKALSAEMGKELGIDVKYYAFGASGTYYVWVEALYGILNSNGSVTDNNDYGYTAQIPASGSVTITRPATGRWRVYYYTALGDTSAASDSGWITTDSVTLTIPSGKTAIRISFQSAGGYCTEDYLSYKFTIVGAVPYGGAYKELLANKAEADDASRVAELNTRLYAEPKSTSPTTMEVGYYSTNGYNKVTSATQMLLYRFAFSRPIKITINSGYSFRYMYGRENDLGAATTNTDTSNWRTFFYITNIDHGWITLNIHKDTNATLTASDVTACGLTIEEAPGVYWDYRYTGRSGLLRYDGTNLSANTAQYVKTYNPGNIPVYQDVAFYGDYLFTFTTSGTFYCWKISTNMRVNNNTSYGAAGHPSSVQFGKELATGSNFPLIYLSNPYAKTLEAFKITGDDTGYTITSQFVVDVAGLSTDTTGIGDTQFYVDADNNMVYLFRQKQTSWVVAPDNGVIVSRFDLPTADKSLADSDIYESVLVNNFNYYALQGGCVKDGLVYFAVGTGPYKTTAYLCVYNPLMQKVCSVLNLTAIFPGEPQAVSWYEQEKGFFFANATNWYVVRF